MQRKQIHQLISLPAAGWDLRRVSLGSEIQPEQSTCEMEEQSDSCLGSQCTLGCPAIQPTSAGDAEKGGCRKPGMRWMEWPGQIFTWMEQGVDDSPKQGGKGPFCSVFMLALLIGRELAL